MTVQAPLSWIRSMHETAACQKIPLWGFPPPFPAEQLSKKLQEALACTVLRITITGCSLSDPSDFDTPFGSSRERLYLRMSPLPGYLVWTVSSGSVSEIAASLLSLQGVSPVSDPDLLQGFYQFLLLRTLSELDGLGTYRDLHPLCIEPGELPSVPCMTIDVSLQVEGKSFTGRLLVSPEFRESFAEKFASIPFDIQKATAETNIETELSIETGSVVLTQNEWNSLREGDLLLLDRCSYDPSSESGTGVVRWAETPCFIVKLKKTGIKILDYAVYNGDTNSMSEPSSPDLPEENSGFEPESDHPVPSDIEAETEQAPSAPPEILTSPGHIPFPVTVEIGRMKMSLEKLLQLSPGNVLELPVISSSGVYLTVHGKKIARGELIKIGDVLGVKILEIGNTSP